MRPDNWMTFELSVPEMSDAGATGAASAVTGGAVGGGWTASGSAIGACGPEWPTAARIFSHTIGRGSIEPTIWLSTPSRCSQAWTIGEFGVDGHHGLDLRALVRIEGAEGIFRGKRDMVFAIGHRPVQQLLKSKLPQVQAT